MKKSNNSNSKKEKIKIYKSHLREAQQIKKILWGIMKKTNMIIVSSQDVITKLQSK